MPGRRRIAIATIALAAGLGFWSLATAQETAALPTPPPPTPTPAPAAIPATEISGHAERTASLLKETSSVAEPRDEIIEIEQRLSDRRQELIGARQGTEDLIERGAGTRQLDDAEKRWHRVAAQIDAWMEILEQRASTLDDEMARVRAEKARWELTLASAQEQRLPPALQDTIRSTLRRIADTQREVSRRRNEILTLQTQVSQVRGTAGEVLASLQDALEEKRRSLTTIDSPPLWVAAARARLDRTLPQQMLETQRTHIEAVRRYIDDEPGRITLHLLLFGAVLGLLMALRRRGEQWAREDESLRATVAILQRPVAATVVLTILADPWIHPAAPVAWLSPLLVVLLIAMLRLLPRLMPPRLRPGLYILVVLFMLDRILILVPEGNLFHRLALLAMSTVIGAALVWFARQIADRGTSTDRGRNRAVVFGSHAGAVLAGIAVVANTFGNVSLATLLTHGTLVSAWVAILMWVGAIVVRGAVTLALQTQNARRLNMVHSSAPTIRRAAKRLIGFSAVLGWLYLTLLSFALLPWFTAAIRTVVDAEIEIGDFAFAPFDWLLFAIAVWVSFKISRFLRFVVEKDVLPRLSLPRGVPGAISRFTHYAVLLVGFVIAATIAGIEFDRIALIVGALGVGIGFGLQNVVNNFVSGLILLFERPIRVGDMIQIGDTFGEVKEIGMRASVVRTWQGAEVIVPNANLISNELINWTLSDRRRRVETGVGVAYGTDPETVLELLLEVAQEHPEVLSDPEPSALFLGFGDSSLDFELRAWTPAFDDWFRVRSELSVAINRALADAGIEIPFPQRDLHLRSVDQEAGDALGAPRSNQTDLSDTIT
jgi:small-conductance mechanosensitive channel